MFYCEPCRQARQWPESFFHSLGPCECCGQRRTCHDMPLGELPEFDVSTYSNSPSIEDSGVEHPNGRATDILQVGSPEPDSDVVYADTLTFVRTSGLWEDEYRRKLDWNQLLDQHGPAYVPRRRA